MQSREYEVVGPHSFTPPGESEPVPTGGRFTTDAPLAHEGALIEGGHLKLAGPPEKRTKLSCPACDEQDTTKTKTRTPKFDTHDELVAHYASDHPALEPPQAAEEV